MFELLLVSMAVAFLLALLDSAIDVLTIFVSPIIVNALFSILFSIGGTILIGYPIKELILRTLAGAFFSRVLLTGAEKLSTYRSATVTARQ
jgi:hypothetical protein